MISARLFTSQPLSVRRASPASTPPGPHSQNSVTPAAAQWRMQSSHNTDETSCLTSAARIREALVQQLVSAVRWEDCMRNCAAAGATEFWECGPGGVLAGLARRTEKSWIVRSFAEITDLPA